ncbi:hypothetical protein [Bradyrhizobium sp. Ash2021]|uniref:hypothetical protein n=1 Tax=Bradyrhizobium sp. Ash2021 TaxID=2954771 RepID=UPI0028169DC3|nr:hypothetical protein [Bradyrhizobium sp. Ash2021]WMT74001.1 hypothetical protein NL528_39860 [Bradyrhizobium sp. Ash2021]
MLNYLKKFTMDILPSVAATIIGAYIVNHYIVSKPGANAPVAAAVSTADPKTDLKPDHKATAYSKPVEKPTEVSNLPEAGVKAKGMSERTLLERSASEKAVVIEKPQDKAQEKADAKSADAKPADAPAETASIPAEPRRHAPAPREKTAVRVVLPSPVQPITPAVAPAPVAVTPNPAPPVEAAVAPDEHRDANDLARAAIERLRGSSDNAPRAQQAARTPDTPRAPEVAGVPDTPRVVTAPALRPLPPPIMVSTPASPAGDALDQGSQPKPPYAGISDPSRPTPPADIPLVRPPLDLRAEAAEPMAKEHTSVADDMLSAAKSVFHAVLPK